LPTIDVELQGLVKRFGDVVAVDHIDLQIVQGEFLALLGPSGCGKTTTLRVVAGFEEPDGGQVLIGGESALGIPPHKRDVNTLFQQYALFPHMTVLDNVAYGLKQRKVAKSQRHAKAREGLALVRMEGLEHRRPAELSGGQQQRVALARALVMNPRVLLLDEPLSALDLKLRKEMQLELKRIQQDVGITFVIVTHDQEEAMALADRIAVMHAGRVELLDAPNVVYDHPATPFVAGFIGDMNHLEGTMGDDGGPIADCGGGVIVRIARTIGEAPAGGIGQRVRVGLRPEDLTARVRGDGEPATVVTTMLVGHEVQVLARLRNGAELLTVQHRATDPELAFVDHGDAIVLTWAPEAPALLGPADAAAGSPNHPPTATVST